MKIGIIIQTRMGSSRLPGKVMHYIESKPVIEHVEERVSQCKFVDQIIIATTTLPQDDVIVNQAVSKGILYFRGSEQDVLQRYYEAAKKYQLDIIVRITSDCPLIDPKVIDAIVEFYKNNTYDIVTNASADLTQRTYPRGLDTEVFSVTVLRQAFENAREEYQREHVTPYIYENSSKIYYYKNMVDYSKYRWTLDTKEDLDLIEKVYKYLYKGEHDFYLKEIIELFEQHPELIKINEHIKQKKIKLQ